VKDRVEEGVRGMSLELAINQATKQGGERAG